MSTTPPDNRRSRQDGAAIVRGFTEADIRRAAEEAQIDITDAQVKAIAAQAAVYEQPETPAAGLHHIVLEREGLANLPEAIEAHFHYLRLDSPSQLGLEVTIFGMDGEVRGSQDFG